MWKNKWRIAWALWLSPPWIYTTLLLSTSWLGGFLFPVSKSTSTSFTRPLNSACAIKPRSGSGTPFAKIGQTENGVNINGYGISGVKYERINNSSTRKYDVKGHMSGDNNFITKQDLQMKRSNRESIRNVPLAKTKRDYYGYKVRRSKKQCGWSSKGKL